MNRLYMCIDLKSFYASVECRERKLDPIKTNLVVADNSRTEKTICLAVSPSLKEYGIKGRARLFEVVKKVKDINYKRERICNYKFKGSSCNIEEIKSNKYIKMDFIIAKPRMRLYMQYSKDIYNIYLKYLSKDDVFSYSIDEVFCDITPYLNYYNLSALEFATMVIKKIYDETGITATAGIGTNLYLAKVAMDIESKHTEPNSDGVRIAYLDILTYRKKLWNHMPITDFWRIGKGYKKKLEAYNIYTMGDVARISINNEDLLYKIFGVNAELLIDHAWGYEPCTIKDIKEYKPTTSSISKGQVLHFPYTFEKAKIVFLEMLEDLALDLVARDLVAEKLVITIGYDIENISNPNLFKYCDEVKKDYYGRIVPKSAHGTITFKVKTSSIKIIQEYGLKLYKEIVNPNLLIRRMYIYFTNIVSSNSVSKEVHYEQFNLFDDYTSWDKDIQKEKDELKEDKKIQKTMINIKNKYGKNAILKLVDLSDGATTIDRNNQIGGHNA